MPLVSGLRRRTTPNVHVPRWVLRAQSGILYVSKRYPADVPLELMRRLRRGTAPLGHRSPRVLGLSEANGGENRTGDGDTWQASPAYVIDLLRRGDIDLDHLDAIVIRVGSDSDPLVIFADVGFILSKTIGSPQVLLIAEQELSQDALDRIPVRYWRKSPLQSSISARDKGSNTMAQNKNDYIQDPEGLRDRLKEIIQEIHDEADPDEMNAYKRFVKRNVSVFSRSYFTAYLVKQFVDGGGSFSDESRRKRSERPQRNDRKKDRNGEEPVGNVAPEDRQTLFVSVGKNRRVYPKDFVALFAELDGVEGDDIGQIKILDNYSFVEVEKEVADTIIGAYDGYEFRGRKLTVNYARNKKE